MYLGSLRDNAPYTLFVLLTNDWLPAFGAEDAMVVEFRERVCHALLILNDRSLRDGISFFHIPWVETHAKFMALYFINATISLSNFPNITNL